MQNENVLGPLFIAGSWRSGSTLISRMMNNHPDCDVTYDTVHFMRFCYEKYDPINSRGQVVLLINDIHERLKERYNLCFDKEDVLDSLPNNYGYAEVYDLIMRALLLQESGKIIWGEKTNLAWRSIDDFFKLFPQGRVIHIVRDPRAVLASWKKFTHAPGNDYLDSIVNCYDSMTKAIKYSSVYADKRYVLLIYENLVKDPLNVMKNLCGKIEIPFHKSMIDDTQFKNMLGERWQSNTIYNDKLQGISTVTVERWKEELNEWEILLTDHVCASCLEFFNYKLFNVHSDKNLLIQQAIEEVQKSNLATEGLLHFLLTGEGLERYPSDPSKKENWGKTPKKVSL